MDVQFLVDVLFARLFPDAERAEDGAGQIFRDGLARAQVGRNCRLNSSGKSRLHRLNPLFVGVEHVHETFDVGAVSDAGLFLAHLEPGDGAGVVGERAA